MRKKKNERLNKENDFLIKENKILFLTEFFELS
jgi:hypothetical protein